MGAATPLNKLLQIEMAISYDTMQLSRISAKYEAIHNKMEKMVKYEDKWENAFEDAQDVDKTINSCGFEKGKGEVFSDAKADAYAHAKVKQYDEDLLIELTEEDMEYDALKTTLETGLTELRAEEESWKQLTSTEAQDTHLLGQ